MNGKKTSAGSKRRIGAFFVKWEMILIYILLAINIMLVVQRPDLYFAPGTVSSMIQAGLDICPLALGMALVMVVGDVDVSCAANMIFCAMVTGLGMDAGIPAAAAVLLGLAAGTVLGAVNGFLVAYIGLPAVITTIGTSLLYRGLVKIILDVNVLKNFPDFYSVIAWRNVAGIPISMILFLAMAVVFGIVLQKTSFGRILYMMGNNPVTTMYSGISVRRIRMAVFMIMGFMSGVASIFYIGRMGGGANSAMGTGSEMTAIAIVALGGIATGSGKMYGPVIATFILAALTYSLGLLGIDNNGKNIFTGIILIISVALANMNKGGLENLKHMFTAKS